MQIRRRRSSFWRVWGTAVISVGALVVIAVAAALMMFAASAADAQEIPRRHDGRPDLSGTYDIATLTPAQRPDRFGDRLELTPEEAAALAEHWSTNFDKDHAPSDPNREAPPKGGTGIYAPEFTGAAGKVGGYNAFFVDIGTGAFQLNGKYRTSIITDPPDGRYPSLSEHGQERSKRLAPFRHENTGTAWWLDLPVGPYDDHELRPLAERCILTRGASGPPSMPGMYNNLKTIVQTDTHVMILIEWMHDVRIIRLDSEHLPDTIRKWSGDSIGRWEGDTLIVETRNFREIPGSVTRGSRDMRVTERFSRIDADNLRYEFTVEDPAYETVWSGEYPWPATSHKLYEYACHEGNYAFGNIMRGARLLEREAMEQNASGGSTGSGSGD